MNRASYPSDLTDQQWAILEPLIPPAKSGGHPRTTDIRELIALLRDGRATRFIVVTRAAELPRRETARLSEPVHHAAHERHRRREPDAEGGVDDAGTGERPGLRAHEEYQGQPGGCDRQAPDHRRHEWRENVRPAQDRGVCGGHRVRVS